MQFLNVFISSPLLLSSFLNRLSFLWSKLWCCNCNSVIHTLILCKIWQYEIKHLKSQICTFTGCMSDHIPSLSTTQLLNMYWMPHRTILALYFLIVSKGWEDLGHSNQWYIKIGEVTMADCIGIKYKTKILNKNSDLRLILDFNWCSIWATVNMGTQELDPPCNLCHMFFQGPKLQCRFFVGLKKSSLCVGVLTKLVSSNCQNQQKRQCLFTMIPTKKTTL